jgi:hypothetical protein
VWCDLTRGLSCPRHETRGCPRQKVSVLLDEPPCTDPDARGVIGAISGRPLLDWSRKGILGEEMVLMVREEHGRS